MASLTLCETERQEDLDALGCRLVRDLPHRGGENSGLPLPTLGAPPLGTCRKDVGKIACAGRASRNRAMRPYRTRFAAGVVVNRSRYPSRSTSSISVKSPRSSASTPTLIWARSAFTCKDCQ